MKNKKTNNLKNNKTNVYKNSNDYKNKKTTIAISILSLIVSTLSLSLSIIVWRQDRNPSITVISSSYPISGTYESYTLDDGLEIGRYLMHITVSVSNNSGQGCTLNCEPLVKYYNHNYKENVLFFPGPIELLYKDGIDPFDSINLAGHESISISFDMFIYLHSEVHEQLKKEFGSDISTAPIDDLLRYLYTQNINPKLTSPQDSMPMYPNNYAKIPNSPVMLILYVVTNTGASDYTLIDYSGKDFFDYVYKDSH